MKITICLCFVLASLVFSTGRADAVIRQTDVFVQLEEVLTYPNQAGLLHCDYSISTGEENLPVTVQWLMGDGPRKAKPIFSCTGYSKDSPYCVTSITLDPNFAGRLSLSGPTPSLLVMPVHAEDNRNMWCQVSLEGEVGKESMELGVDIKSVVLRVRDNHEMPKMHSVTVDNGNIVTHEGEEVTLSCTCSGSHCGDVYWYKGPVTSDGQYDMVYSRISGSRPIPTSYTAYGNWIGRSHLSGDSLVIESSSLEDAGRYWCEVKCISYYGVGEMSTDSKSVVLEVHDSGSNVVNTFSCLDQYDGLYSDPESCTGYYECYGGQTFHKSCPLGTVFNSEPGAMYACDMAENVTPPCGNKVN